MRHLKISVCRSVKARWHMLSENALCWRHVAVIALNQPVAAVQAACSSGPALLTVQSATPVTVWTGLKK